MHIPDGFLSTPVWATLHATAAPAVVYLARKAQRSVEEARIPLMGVLGAFVFAAQMINFPVAPGTTGHLVGGALLAFTLGPAPASLVMTAILTIQALVFQDGGILALGANIVNMALVGVLAGYLPYALCGASRWRRLSIFAGSMLSVFSSAILALSELRLSGIQIEGSLLAITLVVFAISGVLEGAITLAVVEAIEKIEPKSISPPRPARSPVVTVFGLAATLLASVGLLFASTAPDAIQKLGARSGLAAQIGTVIRTPLANYQAVFLHSQMLGKAAAGLAGIALISSACILLGRMVARNRSL